MKLSISCYVQNKSEQASKAGATPNRILRLQSVPAIDSVDNSKAFDSGTPGSVSVDLSGVTADIHAAITGGAAVTVTIETSA